MSYRVLIDLACLEILPKSGKRRDEVINFCNQLVDAIYEASDFQITEPDSQRRLEVSELEGFAITWWVDEPVKRIIVVDILRYRY